MNDESKISITQIGVFTPRDNLGNFNTQKAIPLYVLTSDLIAANLAPKTDDPNEYTDIAGIFCEKQKAYINATKVAERNNKNTPKPTLKK